MTTSQSSECFICVTCGSQFSMSPLPPASCPICEDERQYVRAGGQAWTTLQEIRLTHRNAFKRLEPSLYGIGTTPEFAIGQRALLLQAPGGNILWDCVALLDDATVDIITALGGLSAIAISHPHYYTTMVEWSRAFGGAPIYLHEADRQWVMRTDPAITFWEGPVHQLTDGIRLIHCGGHFAGGAILHWADGAGGRGAILTGDILQVVADRRYVSFMRSYPNFIPLPAAEVERIAGLVSGLRFDRIYGAWWDAHVMSGGQNAVQASAERYVGTLAPNRRRDADR